MGIQRSSNINTLRWLDILENVSLVGSFRHPRKVAASLIRRQPTMSLKEAVDMWCDYNERLLRVYSQYSFPLISFDLEPDKYIKKLMKLFINLEIEQPDDLTFFVPSLRDNKIEQDVALSEREMSIYDELQQVAV